MLAEGKIALYLAGHPNLPYIFGLIQPNKLLFEFVGSGNVPSPTFKDVLYGEGMLEKNWIRILVQLFHAVQYTLREEIFAGRKFRGFRGFCSNPQN